MDFGSILLIIIFSCCIIQIPLKILIFRHWVLSQKPVPRSGVRL